jgi:hypothetical protein
MLAFILPNATEVAGGNGADESVGFHGRSDTAHPLTKSAPFTACRIESAAKAMSMFARQSAMMRNRVFNGEAAGGSAAPSDDAIKCAPKAFGAKFSIEVAAVMLLDPPRNQLVFLAFFALFLALVVFT